MADLSSQPVTIQSVYSWYAEDKLYVNRRYQRKLVWTLEEKQKLIESILKKYPIPAILVAERENHPGTFEIIDGLQRLQAIMSFIETSFYSLEKKYFNLRYFTTAMNRGEEGIFPPTKSKSLISQKEVGAILDYTLALSVMRNATEDEVNDVFDRINTFGHRLSDQERRQAGVQNEFSDMVREIACTLRGDESAEVLLLSAMPSISIDLPLTKHGYLIPAEQVFWVKQGILRSTELRDSMDEQCIADVAASIVGGKLIERSKDILDKIYTIGSNECNRISSALEIYGARKFSEEIKYCIDEIIKVCRQGKNEKLRDIVFSSKKTTNPFPSVFAVLLIAFHELIIKEEKKIRDYSSVKSAITDLSRRIETGRSATIAGERRKNIDQIKGLLGNYFIEADLKSEIYGSHATTDIDGLIMRSEVELANYEVKQGLLTLDEKRTVDESAIEKVLKTVCAIANNGPNHKGKIIIGVANKEEDANRIKDLYNIDPKKVGRKFVVGIDREAGFLGESMEKYFSRWKNAISNSMLSQAVKDSVLSNIDYNGYYGLGVIVITVPPQKELSYFKGDVFWRESDSTQKATSPETIVKLAQRF